MLKEERQKRILELLTKDTIVKVKDITKELDVTEMTVRRDLKELENMNLIIRIHGGAKILSNQSNNIELSHTDKQDINTHLKKNVAKKIAKEIKNQDTVFLGSGTTMELVYDYIDVDFVKIITNSIFIFEKFKGDSRFDVILIGGSYRNRTGAFVGSIANDTLNRISIKKTFVGANGINNSNVTNFNEEEGETQKIALNNADKKYIIADHTKLDRVDFYQFYNLTDVDYLILDDEAPTHLISKYKKIVKII